MFATTQKLTTDLITRLARLECEISVDTSQLEGLVTAVARLDRSQTSAWWTWSWMTRTIINNNNKIINEKEFNTHVTETVIL